MKSEFKDNYNNYCRWCGEYLGNIESDLCEECKKELEKMKLSSDKSKRTKHEIHDKL